MDNIGIFTSITDGNTTDSFGLKVNLSEVKAGFESSAAVQWDDFTQIANTNVSVNGWAIAAGCIFIATGQLIPSPLNG